MGSAQPCPAMQGWREPEALDAKIKHLTQVRIQPLLGEKPTILQEAKKNRASACGNYIWLRTNLWFWMPTANHRNNLHGSTEALTWIFRSAASLSLVWISPHKRPLPPQEKSPPALPISPPFFLFLLCSCLLQQTNHPPATRPLCRPKTACLRGPQKNSKNNHPS